MRNSESTLEEAASDFFVAIRTSPTEPNRTVIDALLRELKKFGKELQAGRHISEMEAFLLVDIIDSCTEHASNGCFSTIKEMLAIQAELSETIRVDVFGM